MDRCAFCPRSAPGKWGALTACKGDPEDAASWRREILPLCPRCDVLISQAGDKGRVLRATLANAGTAVTEPDDSEAGWTALETTKSASTAGTKSRR